MGWRVHAEEPEHFIVHGDVGPFRIHKGNLSKSAIATMRKMAGGGKVQKLAAGGAAEGAPEEPPVPEDEPTNVGGVVAINDQGQRPRDFEGNEYGLSIVSKSDEELSRMAHRAESLSGAGRKLTNREMADVALGSAAAKQLKRAAANQLNRNTGNTNTAEVPGVPPPATIGKSNADIAKEQQKEQQEAFNTYGAEGSTSKPPGPDTTPPMDPPGNPTDPASFQPISSALSNLWKRMRDADEDFMRPPNTNPAQRPPDPRLAALQGQYPDESQAQASMSTGFNLPEFPKGQDTAGMEQQIKAIRNTAESGIENQALAKGLESDRNAAAYDSYVKAARDNADQLKNEVTKSLKQYDSAAQDVKDGKIDPEHFWGGDTFKKVRTGIGIILGGIGSGATGGQNLALKFLEHNIDRDIDAQKANMANRNNVMKWAYDRFGAMNQATEHVKNLLLAQTIGEIDRSAAMSGDQAAFGRAQVLKSEIGQKILASIMDVEKIKADYRMQKYGADMMRSIYGGMSASVGGGGGYLASDARPMQMIDPRDPIGSITKALKDRDERTVPGPNGQKFLSYDKTWAEQYKPRIIAIHAADNIVNKMDQLRREHTLIPGTDASKQYAMYRADLMDRIANSYGNMQPSVAQIKLLEETLPSKWDAIYNKENAFVPIKSLIHNYKVALYKSAGLKDSALPSNPDVKEQRTYRTQGAVAP